MDETTRDYPSAEGQPLRIDEIAVGDSLRIVGARVNGDPVEFRIQRELTYEPDERFQDDERELVRRLAIAQGAFGDVRKTKVADAGRYSYAYASLDDIRAATRGPLAEQEIALTQDTLPRELLEPGEVGVVTVLRYGLARLSLAEVRLPAGEGPQAIGSAMTYARRYSISTALGIAAEEDDDARVATSTPPAPTEARAPATASGGRKASDKAMKRLHALARERGVTHENMREWAERHLEIDSLTKLTTQGAAAMEKSLRDLPVLPAEEQLQEATGEELLDAAHEDEARQGGPLPATTEEESDATAGQ